MTMRLVVTRWVVLPLVMVFGGAAAFGGVPFGDHVININICDGWYV